MRIRLGKGGSNIQIPRKGYRGINPQNNNEEQNTFNRINENNTIRNANNIIKGRGIGSSSRGNKNNGGSRKNNKGTGSFFGNKVEETKDVVSQTIKKRMKFKLLLWFGIPCLFLLFIVFMASFFFKSVDSQTYSNENGGTLLSDKYGVDDKVVNIFANYPGLYEKIIEKTNKVSDEYKIEVDKYLVIATLVAPISNETIVPVEDNSCGEDKCYYFNGESKTWSDFLSAWADQAELLSKMQIITFTNPSSTPSYSCKNNVIISPNSENGFKTKMYNYELLAQNDMEVRKKYAFWWLNPVEWFRGFRDTNEAEFNGFCTDTPSGKTKVPTVTAQSTLEGVYSLDNNIDHEYFYNKDETSGGVYYWNLVNQDGFLYQYLKDYLSDEDKDNPNLNYEHNKAKIIALADEIYSYYDTIKKTCDGHKVLESEIKTIKVYNPPEKQRQFGLPEIEEIDFEKQYVGGVMLAEFSSGGMEGLKAFAILVRSEAIALVGLDGSGTIENSSNAQNYNPNYSPDDSKYDRITQAVRETRGMVLSKYEDPTVWHTEYDNFCPTKSTPENGFFYLPKGQQSLPINIEKYKEITGQEFMKLTDDSFACPCVTEEEKEEGGQYSRAVSPGCWKVNPKTNTGYSYKSSGGHGRGASQHGIKYFAAFGYNQDAILRLFFPGAQVRVLSSLLPENKCANIDYYTGEIDEGVDSNNSGKGTHYSFEYTGSNYTEAIGGRPLDKPITAALKNKGNTVQDLNSCINDRVEKAGRGTREGVVEAGMALLQCTMDLTGGYTYPYDHLGGDVLASNTDLVNKYGINSKWGVPGGSCKKEPCRLGLNCATFVRWSMCNGGMDLCNKGSRAAHEMFDRTYFPEATKVLIAPKFSYVFGNIPVSSAKEAVDLIKPGDILYSEHYPRVEEKDHGNHVMLVVGTTDTTITIAENGRDTRVISKSGLLSPSGLQYGVLLLDDYYANSANLNKLS